VPGRARAGAPLWRPLNGAVRPCRSSKGARLIKALAGGVVLAALVAATSSPVAAAPSEMQDVVLRVGPLEQTLEDFARDFHFAARPDTSRLTPDQAGIETFLRWQIDRLHLGAFALPDTTVLDFWDDYDLREGVENIYREALRDEILPRYCRMGEEIFQSIYWRLGKDLRVAVIRVPAAAGIDSAKAELARGVPFAEVATKYSKDPVSAAAGGEVGWVSAREMSLDSQEALWSQPIGTDTPPIEESPYWAIYRALEERTATPGTFEEERPAIERYVLMREKAKGGARMHDALMEAYRYRVDADAAEWLRDFLQRETSSARRTYDPAIDKSSADLTAPREGPFWPEAPLKGADADRPMAFVDGDTVRALEVIDRLIFYPTLIWPLFDKVEHVTNLCDEVLYARVQVREAMKLGLHDRKEVARKVLDRKRRMLWRAYRKQRILPNLTPTDAELEVLYESQQARWNLPERRRYVLINAPSREVIEKAAELLRQGRAPSSIIREIARPDIEWQVTPDSTAGWRTYGQQPSVDVALFGMEKGETSYPLADRGRYSVVRLEDVSAPHVVPFAQAKEQLARELLAERERAAVGEILQKARAMHEVWVDRDKILGMNIDPRPFDARGRPGGDYFRN